MNSAFSLVAALLVSIAGGLSAAPSSAFVVVPPSEVPGARVIREPGKVPVQTVAKMISPAPRNAALDKARTALDGCMAYGEEVVLPRCVYGHPKSGKSVFMFGDSRAMQYFPAVLPIANRRDWRLTALFKADCVNSLVNYERYCDTWKENMLERIESAKPDLVILGSATKNLYSVVRDGERLSRADSQPYLVDGMVKLIRRVKRTGARVIVIRDQSPAPFDPPDCVYENMNHLRRCAFEPVSRRPRAFERSAALRTNTRIVDPQPMFCSRKLCPAVIGNAIVNKDNYHLTATYSRTLSRWMAGQIPDFNK